MLIEEQPGFVLHTRKYTDSRIIIELLTRDYGRVSGVFRKSKKSGALQGFIPLLVNWQGKSGLKTVTHIEACGSPIVLHGRALYCAFYLNELLVRALAQEDPAQSVFDLYTSTLSNLAHISPDKNGDYPSVSLEQCLRQFEFSLLADLGVGFNFFEDANQTPIEYDDSMFYRFQEDSGFIPVVQHNHTQAFTGKLGHNGILFPATVLVAIRENNWEGEVGEGNDKNNSTNEVLRYAKVLCRTALKRIIGDKPLKSRELFGSQK